MIGMFKAMCEFDTWGNRRVAEAIAATPSVDPSAEKLLAHILAVKELWLRRLRGVDSARFNNRPDWPLAQSLKEIDATSRNWSDFFASLDLARIDQSAGYRDLRGNECKSIVRDILMQNYGHGIHHRAQINLLVRQAGGAPPMIDYLAYARL